MAILRRAKLPSLIDRAHIFSTRAFAGGWAETVHFKDTHDYTFWLQNCRTTKFTREIHAQMITSGFEQNPFLAAQLLGKYTDYTDSTVADARKVFDCLLDRDVFLWNMLIKGYSFSGPFAEALNMYNEMMRSGVSGNKYTYPFVLKACGAMEDLRNGRTIHGHAVKLGFSLNLFVGNALVSFYSKCGEISPSRRVFDGILQKDIVSWNSMISGYSLNGCAEEALVLFHSMLLQEIAPDSATLVSALPACVQLSSVRYGLWIHTYIFKSGLEIDSALGSSLISMYGNCGRLKSARTVFDRIPLKNVAVWNAMIRSYGAHGQAEEAFRLFSEFEELGLRPDGLIFLCLLSTCSHAGMVDEGWELFGKMGDYGVGKREEHYACMVDLLGRAGRLDEAVEFIKSMPVKPGKDVFGALLGGCRINDNVGLAEEVAEKLLVLDPENAGRYIILARMYEDAGRREDAASVRKLLRERNIRKPLGCSSIEVNCIHHTFGVEDKSHPLTAQIFDTLGRLEKVMEENFDASMSCHWPLLQLSF